MRTAATRPLWYASHCQKYGCQRKVAERNMPTTRPAKRTAPATANRLGRAPSASTAGRCRGPRIKASAPVAFLLPQPYFILAALEAPMDRVEVRPGVEATRDFALLLRQERVLVISDLHLGFEGALAEQGVSIPRFQRRVILERLGKMLDRNKAEQVVIAGDFKHEFSKNLVDEWVEVKQVLRFLKDRVKPVLVRGNHDNYLATILGDLHLPLDNRADIGGYTIVPRPEGGSTPHPIIIGPRPPPGEVKEDLRAAGGGPAFPLPAPPALPAPLHPPAPP